MIYFVIPARKGSKGFPGKNRLLFDRTARLLKNEEKVIVTSDDEYILKKAKKYGFECHLRSDELCSDDASMRDVLLDLKEAYNMKADDIIVMLYLTYPKRDKKQLMNFIETFVRHNYVSMICRQPVLTHPYLCVYKDGAQVVSHNKYRRQEYPEVFEISHYMAAFKVFGLINLNKNLYNSITQFYDIPRVVDVDYEKDLKKV